MTSVVERSKVLCERERDRERKRGLLVGDWGVCERDKNKRELFFYELCVFLY